MEAMSNPDVDDEWNQRLEIAVGNLLIGLQNEINEIFENTQHLSAVSTIEIEESINKIFKDIWKELFGYSKEYFQEKESEVQDAS